MTSSGDILAVSAVVSIGLSLFLLTIWQYRRSRAESRPRRSAIVTNETAVTEAASAEALIWRRRIYVAMIFLLAFASGARSVLFRDALGFICEVMLAVFATMCCIVDSQIRGKVIGWSVYWLIFLLWPFAVPAYLIWSRGWRYIPWIILYAAGVLAVTAFGEWVMWVLIK